jgi:hypothetical protein
MVVILSAGCPAPLQYQPAEKLIDELGVPQARQRLEDVLSRSINPRVIDTEVTDEFLRYRYPLAYLLGSPSGATTMEKRLVFQDIGRVEVFENHVIYVWGHDNSLQAQLVFTNAQDARTFADLLYSFRIHRSRPGNIAR